MNKIHPKKNDKGQTVHLTKPSTPSAIETWQDADAVSTVIPDGHMPASANGIDFSPWSGAPTTADGWKALGEASTFNEPPMKTAPGKQPAAGVVTVEADGRVWAVAPSNAFGGYSATFPKGRLDGLSPRASAIREAFEESGLQVELTGYLCDSVRSTTVTRYYTARRVGGNPADMGWESQAVHLVPIGKLSTVVTHQNDKVVITDLLSKLIITYEWGLVSGHRILDTLAGYFSRFGEWPALLTVPIRMYEGLRDKVLSPLGWQLLHRRLEIVSADVSTLHASGHSGQKHTYDTDGPAALRQQASVWLWGADLT